MIKAVVIFSILVVMYVLLMYTINRLSRFEKKQKKEEGEWYTFNKMWEQEELVKKQASKKTYELLNREQGASVQEIADVWGVTYTRAHIFLRHFFSAELLEYRKINNKIIYRFVRQNIDEDRMTSLIFNIFEN